MNIILQVYKQGEADTYIEAAWLELDLNYVRWLLSLRESLLSAKFANQALLSMTYSDPTPYFLAPVTCPDPQLTDSDDGDEDTDFYVIDEEGNEYTLYDIDEWMVLQDGQSFPQDAPQSVIFVYLHVEPYGVFWETRDDNTEDIVETPMLTWVDLEGFEKQLEDIARAENPGN